MPEMQRRSFKRDRLTFSYLDSGHGKPLIALHAHWMEGATFAPLAAALGPEYRLIALDQRGHGFSSHAASYSRSDYLDDISGFFEHLAIRSAVLLGNSLGGVNAYQFAAHHPERVSALIIEDIGAQIEADTRFALAWAGIYPTRSALETQIGSRFVPALTPSIRETAHGWQLAFDPNDTEASQAEINGDHWNDWLASRCPTLLVRGRDSRVTTQAHFEQMATRRPNTELVVIDGGHVVHFDNPSGFIQAVLGFLHVHCPDSCQNTDGRT
jgi:esterase